MHFTAATAALLATMVSGSPLILSRQNQMCDQTPNANTNAGSSPAPIAQPSVATAALCAAQCTGNNNCQSFVFGLPPALNTPECLLFGVPAAQVPPQDNELHVFDKACTDVPVQAPTRDEPRGAGGNAASQQQQQQQAGNEGQQQAGNAGRQQDGGRDGGRQ